MTKELMMDCLNTLQIGRGKEILDVRDIKEVLGHGWNFTMDYKVVNSRFNFVETTFNNLLPRASFEEYVRINPLAVRESTPPTPAPKTATKTNIIDNVELTPPTNPEPLKVNEEPLKTEVEPTIQTPIDTSIANLAPTVKETITILMDTGETKEASMEYHQKMIGKYGNESNLPYTVIG